MEIQVRGRPRTGVLRTTFDDEVKWQSGAAAPPLSRAGCKVEGPVCVAHGSTHRARLPAIGRVMIICMPDSHKRESHCSNQRQTNSRAHADRERTVTGTTHESVQMVTCWTMSRLKFTVSGATAKSPPTNPILKQRGGDCCEVLNRKTQPTQKFHAWSKPYAARWRGTWVSKCKKPA